MPVRVPWSQHETALLIYAYLQISEGADPTKTANELSLALRNLAVHAGHVIDDTYRNVNGMKMQLANVQYLFTNGEKGLSSASSMIQQMYELYKAHPAEYQTILKEAIQMTGNTTMSIEDAFFEYAKGKIGLPPKVLAEHLQNAADYCHLKQPLLGMTDVKAVRNVQQKVAEGNLLRFRFGKNAQTIRNVTQLYYTFIKNYRESKEEPISSIVPSVVENVSHGVANESIAGRDSDSGNMSKTTVTPDNSGEDWIIQELRIKNIPFVDNRNVDGCLWIASDMSVPIPLNEAAERGYHFHLKQDGCRTFPNRPVLWTKDRPEQPTKEVPLISSTDGQISLDAFRQFLVREKGFAERTAGNYWTSIRMIEVYIQRNKLNFSLVNTDADGAQRIFDLLMARPDFEQINIQRHRQFSAALTQYVIYLRQFGSNLAPYDREKLPGQKTIIETVFDVLRKAGKPMTVSEIYQAIIRDNLYPFGAQDPQSVVYSKVSLACRQTDDWIKEGRDVLIRSEVDGIKMFQAMSAREAAVYLQVQQRKTVLETASQWAEYEAVLKQAFQKGFQKESGLDMKKLRKRWVEIHGEELKDSDDTIRLQLAAHCVDTGKRWYLAELLLSEADRQTVLDYIDRVLGSGKLVLYYSSIYATLEHQLESTVLTEDLLISYLLATCQDRYILREHYLTNDRYAQVDLSEEIKDVMLAHGRPIHTDELKRALHHLPPDQVERELHIHSEFIMDAFHMYFHESMADLTAQELDHIAEFIQEELDDQGYMIGDWIQRKLTRLYPETAERLSFLTLLGVRGAVAYKLRDRFTFSGPVITPKGKAMNMIDIFAMFCQHHTPFTLDELAAFAKECDSTIYLDTVHRNCARVSEKEFVATGAVHWDIPHIDAAIALHCPGKYVSLKNIQYFDAFPYVGYSWNSYLLEQYVATVSKEFTLMHSSYAKNNTSGAIVRRDVGFESFDEVLADILASTPIDLEQDSCLDFLADAGYITRRKLSNINEIITRAKMLRSQKG